MDEKLEKFVTTQKEIVVSSYEHAKSYSNIIIFGGYAGLFAVWNFTKNDLVQWQSMTVGLLAILSIVIFVMFELASAWLRGNQLKGLMAQLEQAQRLERFPEDYGRSQRESATKFMRVWPYFFFGAALTGLGAAGVLVYSFIQHLVC